MELVSLLRDKHILVCLVESFSVCLYLVDYLDSWHHNKSSTAVDIIRHRSSFFYIFVDGEISK